MIEVDTVEEERQKGLATIVCAELIYAVLMKDCIRVGMHRIGKILVQFQYLFLLYHVTLLLIRQMKL